MDRDEEPPLPYQTNRLEDRLDLDAPVLQAHCELHPGTEPRPAPNLLGDHQPASGVNGSLHGMNLTMPAAILPIAPAGPSHQIKGRRVQPSAGAPRSAVARAPFVAAVSTGGGMSAGAASRMASTL